MTGDKGHILLIEDEPQMRRFLRVTLQSHGYRLVEASSGQEGLAEATVRKPDVVLLDLGLPDMDGIELTRKLRDWSEVPIIVISARQQEEDKIRALDAGADDYLTKPFGVGELLARMRVALRREALRQAVQKEPVFVLGDLKIDFTARAVYLREKEIHLTPIEYRLLAVLVKNAGKVITHTQLLREVWGQVYSAQTQYLRVYMSQLRRKLEADPARPRYLINEPGVGYRLRIEVERERPDL